MESVKYIYRNCIDVYGKQSISQMNDITAA